MAVTAGIGKAEGNRSGGRLVPQSRSRFVDRRGRVVSRPAWRRLSGCPDYTLVALDHPVSQGRPVQVHTFWLGVAGPDELIFRTVTSDGHGLLAWGWRCETDAREGHAAVCAWLRGQAARPAGLIRGPDTAVPEARAPVVKKLS